MRPSDDPVWNWWPIKTHFRIVKTLDNLSFYTGDLYENHVPHSSEANCWNWSRPSPLSLRSIWDCLVALRWSLLFGAIHLDGRWCWIPHDRKRLLVGGLEHFSFFHILGRIILFFRGVGSTTKQLSILLRWLGFLGPWMTPRWHQGWAAKRMALCMTKSRLAMKPSILCGLADTTLSRTGSEWFVTRFFQDILPIAASVYLWRSAGTARFP